MRTTALYVLAAVGVLVLAWIVFKLILGIAATLFYIAIPVVLLLVVIWLIVRVL